MAREIQENLDFGDIFGLASVLKRFRKPETLLKSRGDLLRPGALDSF
jgi:hypothetical protein